MAWPVDFYEDASGDAPVEQFPDDLTEKQRAKLLGLIQMLKDYGPTLPFPYASQVKGRLRELRTQLGKTRCVFCTSRMPIKNFSYCMEWSDPQKLEESDIKTGEMRMADHARKLRESSKKKGK